MTGPPVVGQPIASPLLLIGQAPGDKEPALGRPFAWTAGKTLFKWFATIGLDETEFRERAYMAAVCRCFPGKRPRGGDRVPDAQEIATCNGWLQREIVLLQPQLLVPVGKLAIVQFLAVDKLVEVIGRLHQVELQGRPIDVLPLPHPSGASTWHRMPPGKELLEQALQLLAGHPAWRALLHRCAIAG
ncbi:MAG: uracil-DNA glycosylase family protein [Sedimenticolaceae bacterium]